MRIRLLLIGILCLAISAQATLLGNRAPEKLNDNHVLSRPAYDDREGGETIGSAIAIPGLPYSDFGATCDNIDNYDEICPYTGSISPDVVYSYAAGFDGVLDIDLCGSLYDTKLYVYDGSEANLIACNDDYYYEEPCGVFVSYLEAVSIQAGHTYYIVIDGYGGDCGEYYMFVEGVLECPVECPPGSMDEGEPPLADEYEDVYNGGCNSIPYGSGEQKWQWLSANDGNCVTLCGGSGWYSYDGGSYRDTDWFLVRASGTQIVCILEAEFETWLFELYDDGTCTSTAVLQQEAADCGSPATINISTTPGHIYQLWVGPTAFSGPVYNYRYNLALCGIQPIDPPVPEFTQNPQFPPAVSLGESFMFQTEVENIGAFSDDGRICVSFPTLTEPQHPDAVGMIYSDMDMYFEYPSESFLADFECAPVESEYLLVEGIDLSWGSGSVRSLDLMITPPEAGPFAFQVRSTMHAAGGGSCSYFNGVPTTGTWTTDQQGWGVKEYTVDVIYDQDKLRNDQILRYQDYNLNGFHDPGEPWWVSGGGDHTAPDNSCWMASASNMVLYEAEYNPYQTALGAGGAASPEYFPWGGFSYAAGGGSAFTFDDGGFQHWLFARYGIGWEGPIVTTVQFAPNSWEINPVAWCADQIGMGHPVGIAFYWGRGDLRGGTLPTGFDRDRVSGYHAVTLWDIDTVGHMLTISDSDDAEAILRELPYEYQNDDWYIPAGAYHAQALFINYAVSSRGETPVMVSDFSYTQQEGAILFSWEAAAQSDIASYKVKAERGADSWELSATETAPGHFEAADRSTNYLVGGDILYGLYSRVEGGNWEWIAEHRVQVASQQPVATMISSYPNPFNPSTLIEFNAPAQQRYRIFVADISGRMVAVLQEGISTGASVSFEWKGSDEAGRRLSSGVYFLVLETPGRSDSRKIVILQ